MVLVLEMQRADDDTGGAARQRYLIYQSAMPLCHARRDSANSQGQEHRIHFTFRPRRSITWTGYRDQVDLTGAAQALEGDMWEAGADPDALLIGVTFADADKIYINTIHIAHPTQRDETEIARGLVFRELSRPEDKRCGAVSSVNGAA